MRPENHALLKTTHEWLDTSFSTNIQAYQQRIKQLLDAFGDLYTSDLFNVHKYSGTTNHISAGNQFENEQRIHEDNSSVSSMSLSTIQEPV